MTAPYRYDFRCLKCGVYGKAMRYGKKYCSDLCRQKDYNEIRKWKNK